MWPDVGFPALSLCWLSIKAHKKKNGNPKRMEKMERNPKVKILALTKQLIATSAEVGKQGTELYV